MKYSCKFRYLICLIIIGILLPTLPAAGQGRRQGAGRGENRERQKPQRKQKEKPIDFTKLPVAYAPSWQFASENTSRLPVFAERDNVYLPLNDGRVVALNTANGEFRWETQPGGRILSPIVANQDLIYLSLRPGSGSESADSGLLRAVNRSSGLTTWTKEFAQPFSSPLLMTAEIIYAINEDQNLYALNAGNGEKIWSAPLGSISRSKPLLSDDEIIIGTEAGLLQVLSKADGKAKWQFQAQGALRGTATANQDAIYFGDSYGYIYCLERQTGKERWRVRTGAAIETAPHLIDKIVMVASFDNFIYALDAKRGDRVWKVRMQGRISYEPINLGEQTLVTPLGGDQLVLLSNTGKVLGQFRIDAGEIVAPPLLQDEQLFIVTDSGLIAARAQKIEPKNKENKEQKESKQTAKN